MKKMKKMERRIHMPRVKVLVVCGAGLGSSFACQMVTEEVFAKYNIDVDIDHADISSAVSMNADIIITASNFKKQFDNYNMDEEKTSIVYLKNVVSKEEISEKVVPVVQAKLEK